MDFTVGLASIRIVKPGEQGFLKQVSDCRPDAILVRSLGAVGYYRQNAPEIPLIGDYALNVANELTAAIFLREGLLLGLAAASWFLVPRMLIV